MRTYGPTWFTSQISIIIEKFILGIPTQTRHKIHMPQSLSCNLIHLVFSTKNREKRLYRDLRPGLFSVMATIVHNTKSHAYRVGGVDDHVHLAIRLHPTLAGAQLVNILKTQSSQWIKEQSGSTPDFAWQGGYGLFSVSKTHLPKLIDYIDNQESHHHALSFQDEFREICRKNDIEIDERYVWD